MKFKETKIKGVYLIHLDKKKDNRGFFARYFCSKEFSKKKLNTKWVQINNSVNTELAIRYGDHVGGHMVQGHVDEKGIIKSLEDVGGAWVIEISASSEFLRYLVDKGFVAIDGMSITVVSVSQSRFSITLVHAVYARCHDKCSIFSIEILMRFETMRFLIDVCTSNRIKRISK